LPVSVDSGRFRYPGRDLFAISALQWTFGLVFDRLPGLSLLYPGPTSIAATGARVCQAIMYCGRLLFSKYQDFSGDPSDRPANLNRVMSPGRTSLDCNGQRPDIAPPRGSGYWPETTHQGIFLF
jgi:hypothetical protein